jgi:hypothetical protein
MKTRAVLLIDYFSGVSVAIPTTIPVVAAATM